MNRARSFFRRLCFSFRREQLDRAIHEELASHLKMHVEDNVRSGMTPEEARRDALIKLGGVEQTKERIRDSHGFSLFEGAGQDLRYGLRMLGKNPGFTAVAILSLALGIGANTAIFSLIDTLMLRTLPVREPGQLVALLHRYPAPGEPHDNTFSLQTYRLMQAQNHVFSGLIAASYRPVHAQGNGVEPQIVNGGFAEGNFFSILGMTPALGRLISPSDNNFSDPNPVAVLCWSFWKSRFNLDPSILGQQLLVDGVSVTMIGVAPRNFTGLQVELTQDLWLPLAMAPVLFPSAQSSGSIDISLFGRLKPGVSLEEARAEMAVLYESTLDEQARITGNPYVRKFKFEMEPAGVGLSILREDFAKPLLMLMAGVGLLLMIACANIATLLLARGASREQEMAVRVTLGAGRLRLVRQVLTESSILSLAGCLLGIVLAYSGTGILVRIIVASRRIGPPLDLHVHLDPRLVAFTTAVTFWSAILFSLWPAIRAVRPELASSLRRTGGSRDTRSSQLFGKYLVSAQVALSIVLLSVTILFVRYLSQLEHLNLGFQRDELLLVSLDPAHSGLDDESLFQAYRELTARLEAIPGVRSVSICGATPISGAGANQAVVVEGYDAQPGEIRNVAESWIAPKFFQTLGTPFLAGRDFELHDQERPRVVIINETMARYYFPGRTAIGQSISFDRDNQRYEIVGVVGNSKLYDIREPFERTVYFNMLQETSPGSQFVVRTDMPPAVVAPEILREVHSYLKSVTIKTVKTMDQQVDETLVPERLMALLSSWFGVIGAVLCATGLYGLLAYTVSRRIHEIGIRMALGASPSNVARLVLKEAFEMLVAGLFIGVPIALWGKHVAASVFESSPVTSVIPIVVGSGAMIAIAVIAAYLPAHRAAKLDPMIALRHE